MRMEEAEDQIDNTEDKIKENNEDEKKRERKLLDQKYRPQELRDSSKHSNIYICITGVPEEQEKGIEGLFERTRLRISLIWGRK